MVSTLRNRLSVQASHYTVASALSVAAGAISFPFLTRVLTVGEYGLMGLVSTTLSLLVGFGKVGMQHSIVRFHGEADTGKGSSGIRSFYSTAVLTMAGTGIAAAALWAFVGPRLSAAWFTDPRLPGLFLLTAILLATRVVESALVNLLRAEQRSRALMVYRVVRRYAVLAFVVVALLLVARSVYVFFAALIVSELLLLGRLATYLFAVLRRPTPSLGSFSPELLRRMAVYGIPMMLGYELAGAILDVGDRYVVEALLGAQPLGLYSAAYNLCDSLRSVFIVPFAAAVTPIYMRMWAEEGAERTRAFLGRSLRQYVLLTVPVIAGLSAVGPELLPLLASDRYAAGGIVVPSVVAGMVFSEATVIVGAGLFLQKRTATIMTLVVSAAGLNVGMNLALIPRIGILGAAVATLVSYAALLVATTVFARRYVAVAIPWNAVAKAGLIALGMFLVVRQIDAGGRVATLVLRVATGVAIYGSALIAVDSQARQLARRVSERLRG